MAKKIWEIKWKERREFDKEKTWLKEHSQVIFDTENTSDSVETWGLI